MSALMESTIKIVLTVLNINILAMIVMSCFVLKFNNSRPTKLFGVGFIFVLFNENFHLLSNIYWNFDYYKRYNSPTLQWLFSTETCNLCLYFTTTIAFVLMLISILVLRKNIKVFEEENNIPDNLAHIIKNNKE